MKKRGLKNALDLNQPEDARMENSCCVSEAHLARVTAGQARHTGPTACLDSTFLPWPEFTQPLPPLILGKWGGVWGPSLGSGKLPVSLYLSRSLGVGEGAVPERMGSGRPRFGPRSALNLSCDPGVAAAPVWAAGSSSVWCMGWTRRSVLSLQH